MCRTVVALVLGMCSIGTLQAVQPGQMPSSPPPRFVMLSKKVADEGVIHHSEVRYIPVTKEYAYQVEVDGRVEVRTKTVTETVAEMREVALKLDAYRLTDGKGKSLSEDQWLSRAKVGSMILIAAGPEGVDEAYQKLFEDSALTLIPRKRAGPVVPEAPRIAPAPIPAPAVPK